jgi:hypothetical protein
LAAQVALATRYGPPDRLIAARGALAARQVERAVREAFPHLLPADRDRLANLLRGGS